jgi:hypothetical protein
MAGVDPDRVREEGWSAIVADLLADLDAALANDPGAGVDVLDVSEREGRLRVVYDLTGSFVQATAAAVESTVAAATARSEVTCSRCGRPGVARRHPSWLVVRCEAHEASCWS